MKLRNMALAAIMALAASAGAANAEIIYSTADTPGGGIGGFGQDGPGNPTFGMQINTGNADILNSFEFFVNTFGQNLNIVASVFAWNGAAAVGPALFQTSPLTVNTDSYDAVHIGTGDLQLASNTKYVLFFSAEGLQQTATELASFLGSSKGISYGSFVWHDNGSWGGQGPGSALAFKAIFNGATDNTITGAVQVPGPEAGAGLGALALGGMALLMKRRRKSETSAG